MPKEANPYVRLVLDARNGGVEKALKLAQRFIDENGKPTEEEGVGKAMNRKESRSHIMTHARKMIKGLYTDFSSELVQTKKGFVKNGRHRLLAFVEAARHKPDLVIKFWMRTNVDDAQAHTIKDDEKPESQRDRWIASGVGNERKNHASIIQFILFKGGGRRANILSDDIRIAAEKWKDHIFFIERLLNGKEKVSAAHIVAPIVRALIATKKRKEIERFCAILASIEVPDLDQAPWEKNALMIKDFIQVSPGRSKGDLCRLYKGTEMALQLFLEKAAAPEKVRFANSELFLMPDDRVFDPNQKAVVLIPLNGAPWKRTDNAIKALLASGRIPLCNVKVRRIAPKTKVYVFCPNNGHKFSADEKNILVAYGTFSKLEGDDNGNSAILLKDIKPISGRLSSDKLLDLSIAARGIPDMKKIAQEFTKLHPTDIEIIAK